MKGLTMNKVLGTIKKKSSSRFATSEEEYDASDDSPEAIAVHYVKQFCETAGRESTDAEHGNNTDDVTLLPPIVDAAESSPLAAAACARALRTQLQREYWGSPKRQYNALMLVRILADNPGQTFTRNLDKKFTDTTKELFRHTKDQGVCSLLAETLDSFERNKAYDEGLALILEMWRKEKMRVYGHARPLAYPPTLAGGHPQQHSYRPHHAQHHHSHQSQNYFARSHSNRRLPAPAELANRLEEARSSAKLLTQFIACATSPNEVLNGDLVREFADRCLSASRSIQAYMRSTDPVPDNDTMESLINTNESLQAALSAHQRAVLEARKKLGASTATEAHSAAAPSEDHDSHGQQHDRDSTALAAADQKNPNNSQRTNDASRHLTMDTSILPLPLASAASQDVSPVSPVASLSKYVSRARAESPPPLPNRKLNAEAPQVAEEAAGTNDAGAQTTVKSKRFWKGRSKEKKAPLAASTPTSSTKAMAGSSAAYADTDDEPHDPHDFPRLDAEPFHPGFGNGKQAQSRGERRREERWRAYDDDELYDR